ncbi:MAG: 5'-methylthioadenosine/S-adenosylhomocysteine nucleosidase [Bifidobacteriaceae bacterium]|jgi:5'-methylthioadenosine/S-adenosylhomocysteine nucleosidase|nr:5'-methylthioadenosine/S-adenosylhomocysteine nucleosidase [Bifidobacteriaceae bacterium]
MKNKTTEITALNLSKTAEICAFARANHIEVSDTLTFEDVYAKDLIGSDKYETMKNEVDQRMLDKYIKPIVLTRAKFTEDELIKFSRIHSEFQYVISGAGYDTFAFSNKIENVTIFEIDREDMVAYKKERISNLGWKIPENVIYVPVDFEKDNLSAKLLSAGFNPDIPTFISILGVSYYLEFSDLKNMFEMFATLTNSECKVVFDFPCVRIKGHELQTYTNNLGEIMVDGHHYDDMHRLMKELGYIVDTHLQPADIEIEYFAQKYEKFHAVSFIHLMSAVKNDETNYKYKVIQTAVDREFDAVVAEFSGTDLENAKTNIFIEHGIRLAKFDNVIIAQSGIGKASAARCAQYLIDRYNVKYIVSAGSAGTANPDLKFFDFVIGTKYIQIDFDLTAFGNKLGEIDGLPQYFLGDSELASAAKFILPDAILGTIGTADKFSTDSAAKLERYKELGVEAEEMESAAIAQVCHIENIPFLAVRCISDKPSDASVDEYEGNLAEVTKRCAEISKLLTEV